MNNLEIDQLKLKKVKRISNICLFIAVVLMGLGLYIEIQWFQILVLFIFMPLFAVIGLFMAEKAYYIKCNIEKLYFPPKYRRIRWDDN